MGSFFNLKFVITPVSRRCSFMSLACSVQISLVTLVIPEWYVKT